MLENWFSADVSYGFFWAGYPHVMLWVVKTVIDTQLQLLWLNVSGVSCYSHSVTTSLIECVLCQLLLTLSYNFFDWMCRVSVVTHTQLQLLWLNVSCVSCYWHCTQLRLLWLNVSCVSCYWHSVTTSFDWMCPVSAVTDTALSYNFFDWMCRVSVVTHTQLQLLWLNVSCVSCFWHSFTTSLIECVLCQLLLALSYNFFDWMCPVSVVTGSQLQLLWLNVSCVSCYWHSVTTSLTACVLCQLLLALSYNFFDWLCPVSAVQQEVEALSCDSSIKKSYRQSLRHSIHW